MTYFKALPIALCLFVVGGIAAAGAKDPEKSIESEKRERVQTIGQALLKARAQSRQEVEGKHRIERKQMEAVHQELEAYLQSLLAVQGSGNNLLLTPNETGGLGVVQEEQKEAEDEDHEEKEKDSQRLTSHHHKAKASFERIQNSTVADKANAHSDREQRRIEGLEEKLSELGVELDRLSTLPRSQQIATVQSLLEKTHLQKRGELNHSSEETSAPEIPSIEVRTQHR